MKKSMIALASLVAVIAGCQMGDINEPLQAEGEGSFITFTESFVQETKTAMTARREVVWSEDDRVAVFQGSTIADEYVVSPSSVGSTNGSLIFLEGNSSVNGDFTMGTELPHNVAYYPYSYDLSLSGASLDEGTSYVIEGVFLPEFQMYVPGSFGNGSFPMVGVTRTLSDHTLKFKNVLGAMKLQLMGNCEVSSITVEGNSREILSGEADITVFADNSAPVVDMCGDEPASVTLSCGGVQLNDREATEFILALPPTVFKEGFTVTVRCSDNMKATIVSNSFNTVKRSSVLAMPEITITEDMMELDSVSGSGVEDPFGPDEANYLMALATIYNQFVSMTGVPVPDGGASEFVRSFWTIQEMPADAVKCSWIDTYVIALNTNTWSSAVVDPIFSVYKRTLLGVSYVNEFLRQTTDEKLASRGCSAAVRAKIQEYRAEARFIRAFFYWAAMDTFGRVPFTTESSPTDPSFFPAQLERVEMFDFIVNELRELSDDSSAMPAARSAYPHADRGSVLGLLARVYLNAEVYTGMPRWEDAMETCERIFDLGYTLAPTHAELFRGDNGENPDARNEFLFAVTYDSENIQSYGGTTFIASASVSVEDDPVQLVGMNNAWAGIRVPYEYVQNWFTDVKNPDYGTGEYTYSDKRAGYFHIKGRSESMEDNLYSFLNGWSLVKFNNIPHDVSPDGYSPQGYFSDIDFPLIRLGEIHLIYAEACCRLGDNMRAMEQLEQLAQRSGVGATIDPTLDYILAERSRELMWEGHRRTDLIRFGKWISGYNWTYKGGVFQGFDLPPYYDLFPIPMEELSMNPNLMQNPGY